MRLGEEDYGLQVRCSGVKLTSGSVVVSKIENSETEWEMGFWQACRLILIVLTEMGRRTTVGGAIPQVGSWTVLLQNETWAAGVYFDLLSASLLQVQNDLKLLQPWFSPPWLSTVDQNKPFLPSVTWDTLIITSRVSEAAQNQLPLIALFFSLFKFLSCDFRAWIYHFSGKLDLSGNGPVWSVSSPPP